MLFRRIAAVFLLLLLAVASPSALACKFECRQGVDDSNTAFAHCVEYFFGSWPYATCEEYTPCWKMRTQEGVTVVCGLPECRGTQCFMV